MECKDKAAGVTCQALKEQKPGLFKNPAFLYSFEIDPANL
jgi:hypothetical protein